MIINHVALCVESVDDVLEKLSEQCRIGKIEEFESEGTREVYVTDANSNCASLLLMEPIGEGPYRRSLEKRGPGLHHICVAVPETGPLLAALNGAGIKLHSISAKTIKEGCLWAYKPGMPFLIEVVEEWFDSPLNKPFVQAIAIKMEPDILTVTNDLLGEMLRFDARVGKGIRLSTSAGNVDLFG